MTTPFAHHTKELLDAITALLCGARGESVSCGVLMEAAGIGRANLGFAVQDLRRKGRVIQTDREGGYYLSATELPLTRGTCVRTPKGVGLVTFARDGFLYVTVAYTKSVTGDGVLEKVHRDDVTTIGFEEEKRDQEEARRQEEALDGQAGL